jgi:hypothetical protein
MEIMAWKKGKLGEYADTNDKKPFISWGFVDLPSVATEPNYDLLKEFSYAKTFAYVGTELLYDRRIEELQNKVNDLEKRISKICQIQIELRTITYKQACKEITEYFKKHHGENIYPHEIMLALKIDIDLVEKIIEDLTVKGQIKEVN